MVFIITFQEGPQMIISCGILLQFKVIKIAGGVVQAVKVIKIKLYLLTLANIFCNSIGQSQITL
jgi:hypothetical protein